MLMKNLKKSKIKLIVKNVVKKYLLMLHTVHFAVINKYKLKIKRKKEKLTTKNHI